MKNFNLYEPECATAHKREPASQSPDPGSQSHALNSSSHERKVSASRGEQISDRRIQSQNQRDVVIEEIYEKEQVRRKLEPPEKHFVQKFKKGPPQYSKLVEEEILKSIKEKYNIKQGESCLSLGAPRKKLGAASSRAEDTDRKPGPGCEKTKMQYLKQALFQSNSKKAEFTETIKNLQRAQEASPHSDPSRMQNPYIFLPNIRKSQQPETERLDSITSSPKVIGRGQHPYYMRKVKSGTQIVQPKSEDFSQNYKFNKISQFNTQKNSPRQLSRLLPNAQQQQQQTQYQNYYNEAGVNLETESVSAGPTLPYPLSAGEEFQAMVVRNKTASNSSPKVGLEHGGKPQQFHTLQ